MEIDPKKASTPLDPTKQYGNENPALAMVRPVKAHRVSPMSDIARRASEVYMRTDGNRLERINKVMKILKSRYGVVASGEEIKGLLFSRRAYQFRSRLRTKAKHYALKAMGKRLPEVVEDYHWSREAAREQGDYKEVRMAAIDHLDRLGVTLKRDAPTQAVQVVVLKGRNFDLADLDKPTPLIETAEIVQETPESDG